MWRSSAQPARWDRNFCLSWPERKFPISNLSLLASAAAPAKKSNFAGTIHTVKELTKDSFKDVKIAFFCAGGSVSKEFAPAAVAAGAVVIDNTQPSA